MHSLTPDYLNRIVLTPEQGSTLNKIGEYKGKQDLFEKGVCVHIRTFLSSQRAGSEN